MLSLYHCFIHIMHLKCIIYGANINMGIMYYIDTSLILNMQSVLNIYIRQAWQLSNDERCNMKELKSKQVKLCDGDLRRREIANREYLMKLTSENLLLNYKLEAGRYSGRELDSDAHRGWESPVCQLRGHFLGHWLSAAAIHYDMSGDMELKAKADAIIDELAECQKDNGGQWAGPIAE